MGQLVVVLSRPYGKPKRLGPYPKVRFDGERINDAPGSPTLAEHKNHEWIVEGERFSRLDFEGPVKVHFVNGITSKTYGPFKQFSSVDGVAFQEGHVFAFVDRRASDWYCHDDGRHWPLMVVEPVE